MLLVVVYHPPAWLIVVPRKPIFVVLKMASQYLLPGIEVVFHDLQTHLQLISILVLRVIFPTVNDYH